MVRLWIICSFALTGCFQSMSEDGDLYAVPVTNNPHIIPSHGSGLPMVGGSGNGPY